MTLAAPVVTRLEKAAMDNGFDLGGMPDSDWLAFASSQSALRVWLTAPPEAGLAAAFSQLNVARALAEYGAPAAGPLPSGAVAARGVPDMPALHRLLRRAFQLSRTLPDELLHAFAKKAASLPRTTEAERLMVQRVGQDIFRAGLMEYWEARCAITGLDVALLLRASHIKPWADCAGDAERLDVFNGLLLAPHLDAAFDGGFVSVADAGTVLLSPVLSESAGALLGLDRPLRVAALADGHRIYLPWHRSAVFRSSIEL